MTTPSGTISLNDVNVELGKSGTTTIALGDTDVRGLAEVASGAISMNNLRGKSNRASISYTFSANTANASLNVTSIAGYSAGKSDITVTINSGVYLYATSTGSYGLNITGGTTGDTLTIVNNGYIMGQGGNGASVTTSAQSGGSALNLGFGMSSCTINNTNGSAYIGGGGGGGANVYYTNRGTSQSANAGGGGAGGGAGGQSNYGSTGVSGGSGGGIGSSGGNGTYTSQTSGKPSTTYYVYSGAGGGRAFSGSGGSGAVRVGTGTNGYARGGTAGGGGGGAWNTAGAVAYGGDGGSGNSGGGSGTYANNGDGGGGGGWGASGGSAANGNPSFWTTTSAGAGGKAVNTNGKSVTWASGDTSRVYGAVS